MEKALIGEDRRTPVPTFQPDMAVPPASEARGSLDTQMTSKLVWTFLNKTAPETIRDLRQGLEKLMASPDAGALVMHLANLGRSVHNLAGCAALAGLHDVARVATALESLLTELHDHPNHITAPSLRTVSDAVEFMNELFSKGSPGDTLAAEPGNVLVVDDEPLCRRAVTQALEMTHLSSVIAGDASSALQSATGTVFDLIILDVGLPDMDGFELCRKIRSLPNNRTTTVIFVTLRNDFRSRAQSSLSGGSDFMTKPFLGIDLGVKALIYVLRSRLVQR